MRLRLNPGFAALRRPPSALRALSGLAVGDVTLETLSICGFSEARVEALLEAGVLELCVGDAPLPAVLRRYLREQFPHLASQWPLTHWLGGPSPETLWVGIPYESPKELAGSTSIGCARVIDQCAKLGSEVFGVVPAKMPGETVDTVLDALYRACAQQTRLCVIGGDHRVTWSLLCAVKSVEPHRRLVHVQLDAHHDLYHGDGRPMPVNPANFNLFLLEDGVIETLTLLGCRDDSRFVDDARRRGFHVLASLDWTALPADAHVHVSIDMDVLDPRICAGVTNPIPDGWSWDRLTRFLVGIFDGRTPDSVSIVEATSADPGTPVLVARLKARIDGHFSRIDDMGGMASPLS